MLITLPLLLFVQHLWEVISYSRMFNSFPVPLDDKELASYSSLLLSSIGSCLLTTTSVYTPQMMNIVTSVPMFSLLAQMPAYRSQDILLGQIQLLSIVTKTRALIYRAT